MIRWATGRPAVVWSFAIALVLAGGVAFSKLPLATRTEVELPRLTVQAAWPGASAELVEMYLTSPVESAIQPVRGVKKTSSASREGSSSINVELQADTDVQMTRLAILERLELLRSEYPLGVIAPSVSNFVPEDLAEQPLLQYTVAGPYTPGALQKIVEDQVTPRLQAVTGVSTVQQYGGAEIGIAVSYDPVHLRRLGIEPAALNQALGEARQVEPLGEDHLGIVTRPVSLRDLPRTIEDLGTLPVMGAAGRIFPLGDLASIRLEEDTRGSLNRLNGQPAVTLTISRLAGADAIKTAARIRETMNAIGPALPPGIRFRVAADESIELDRQLRDLMRRGAIAAVAVAIVLLLSLRNLTSVGLVMGSAAVAIAGTALGLYLLNIPANLLTLAGLGMGIGILVQNGLIVVERLRGAPDTVQGRADAGRRIVPAVVGATLTTAVVLIPFLYLQGDARAAFVPFASAFAMALGWSVLASVVMIPAVGTGHGKRHAGWRWMHRAYSWILIRTLRLRWAVLTLTVAALGILTWAFIKKVPRFNWGGWGNRPTTLTSYLRFPGGSDQESLDRALAEFEQIAVGQDGVERVQARGAGNRGSVTVVFEREAGLTALPLFMQEEFNQRAVLIGGASVTIQGQGPAFSSGGGGAAASSRIKLLGFSYSGLEQFAIDLQERLERIPRVRNVNINAGGFFFGGGATSVTLEPDRAALAKAGLTVARFAGTVQQQIRGAGGGQRMEIGGEEVTVTLKAAGSRDRSIADLRMAQVANPARSPVRVGDLSQVDEMETLGSIRREDQQYIRYVQYDFRGPNKLAKRTHDAFMASIAVPAGYSASDEQFGFQLDESAKGLWVVFGAGVLLVLLAVAMVFDSTWAAAMVFLSLPVALAGVVAIYWPTGAAFGREAAVGVILVVGLAVNQSILLVDAALARRRHVSPSGERVFRSLSGVDILRAAQDRAGMILLVTFTTLASLLPLAIGTPIDSLFGSIALATTGGTIAGTIGALFVLPLLLLRLRRPSKVPPTT